VNPQPPGLLQMTSPQRRRGVNYHYDSKFNLTEAGPLSVTYDAANQPVSPFYVYRTGGTNQVNFVYDGLGRCVKQTIGPLGGTGVSTLFIYDEWKAIAELDAWNFFHAWNVYGAGADEILLRNTADEKYDYIRFLQDQHGNVAFLLDNDGHVLEKYTYDAFGRPTIAYWDGSAHAYSYYGHRFLFQGRDFFHELGIYDYRHRLYQSETGHFLQIDPMGFDAGDINLFRYCADDPVDLNDPMGLDPMLVPPDVDFYSRAAALEAERLYKSSTDGMERNIGVFDRGGRLYLSDARVGWRDSSGKLRSRPPDPPQGVIRRTGNHNHPNGTPLSGGDRVASDNRHEPAYVKGKTLQRWRPDDNVATAARHKGGIRESWSERTGTWVPERPPRLPEQDRSSVYSGQGRETPGREASDSGASKSGMPDAKSIDNFQLILELSINNNSGEGFHPSGPR
jgi:RHS repeat-associated protein